MKGYKGFNKGLVCNGKQYAENTVFEEAEAIICHKGMHFCENPFDVLDHYGFVNDKGELNEFAEVEALEEAKTDDNKKYCTTKLKVGAKLSFAGFIKTCIDFVIEKTKIEECTESDNDEEKAKIGSSGDWAKIGSSGDWAKIGSSGYGAQIGSSGYGAQIGSSGYGAKIGSSGYGAQIGSSGDWAQIGSSGYGAKIGSSGDWAKIGSSGYGAKIGSSGYGAKIESTGKRAVVMCAGNNSMAKAQVGSWITLAEWKEIDGVYTPVCVKTRKVDGKRIKADTFYKLVDGKFVKVGD